jgi:hypothetical protein
MFRCLKPPWTQVKSQKRIDLIQKGHCIVSFKEHDHVLTSLLKNFLRKLPNPVIPFENFENFMEVMEYDSEYRKESLKELVSLLNPHHASLLHFLCSFLWYLGWGARRGKMKSRK